MTVQIQQLSNKAKAAVPHGLSPDKWIEVYNEKFAELIVGECAMVLSKVPGGYDSAVFYKNSKILKEHFGVKE